MFHQIHLEEEETQALTTIVTPIDTYKYTVIPFSIKTAPSALQRIIEKALRSCVGSLVYIDDVLVVAKIWEELILRSEIVKK